MGRDGECTLTLFARLLPHNDTASETEVNLIRKREAAERICSAMRGMHERLVLLPRLKAGLPTVRCLPFVSSDEKRLV